MTFRPVEFAVEVRPQTDATQVRVRGELDMATVGDLHAVLRAQQERGRSVLLDLSQVSFMDSSALRLLMQAQAHANRDRWNLSLHPDVTEIASRLLDLTGVRSSFLLAAARLSPLSRSLGQAT